MDGFCLCTLCIFYLFLSHPLSDILATMENTAQFSDAKGNL